MQITITACLLAATIFNVLQLLTGHSLQILFDPIVYITTMFSKDGRRDIEILKLLVGQIDPYFKS